MSVTNKIYIAYFWNMLAKFFIRGMGIFSTLILVRLLSPDDYGLVAIAGVVAGLFEVLTNFGVFRYLVIKENITDDDLHRAWSVNFIFKGGAMLLIFLMSPYIAGFLNEPEAVLAIRLTAVVYSVGLFYSIRTVAFHKALDFKKLNAIKIFAKITSTVATIICAFIFKNYYALIIGLFIHALADVVISHIVAPYLPKFMLKGSHEMFSFSKFIMVRNILGYSRSQADILLVGRFFGTDALGNYKVAQQFAIMPQTEILSPVMGPLIAGLAQVKSQMRLVYTKFYQLIFFFWSFVLASAIGLYFIADDFAAVVLGAKWLTAAPLLANLGFLMLPFITQPLLYNLYDLENKTKLSVFNDLVALTLLLTCFYYFQPVNEIEFSHLRIEIGFIVLASIIAIARINLNISCRIILLITLWIFPPILALLTTLIFVRPLFEVLSPIVRMVGVIISGGGAYLVVAVLQFILIDKLAKHSFIYNLYPDFIVKKWEKGLLK